MSEPLTLIFQTRYFLISAFPYTNHVQVNIRDTSPDLLQSSSETITDHADSQSLSDVNRANGFRAVAACDSQPSDSKEKADPFCWTFLKTNVLDRICCRKLHSNGRSNCCLSNVCPDEMMIRRRRLLQADGNTLRRKQVIAKPLYI
jgi:hypothetical protein